MYIYGHYMPKKDIEKHHITFETETLRKWANKGYICKSSDGKRILNLQQQQ